MAVCPHPSQAHPSRLWIGVELGDSLRPIGPSCPRLSQTIRPETRPTRSTSPQDPLSTTGKPPHAPPQIQRPLSSRVSQDAEVSSASTPTHLLCHERAGASQSYPTIKKVQVHTCAKETGYSLFVKVFIPKVPKKIPW